VTGETIEQLKARLKRGNEEKELASQKRLEEIRKSQAPFRAEQETRKRAEEQERKKLLDGARQKREQEMKDSACRSWTAAGGTEEEFEESWSSLRTEMLKRRTLENEEQARTAQRRHNIRSF